VILFIMSLARTGILESRSKVVFLCVPAFLLGDFTMLGILS